MAIATVDRPHRLEEKVQRGLFASTSKMDEVTSEL